MLIFSDIFPTFDGMKMKGARRKPETVKVGNITVRVYRREKNLNGKTYAVFEVADYSTGRRVMHSISDHSKAIEKAQTIARQLSTGEATAAGMRNGDAASFGRAVELLAPTGAPLEIAASVYAKCFEILGGDRMIEAANFFQKHRPDLLTRKAVAEVVAELVAAKEARGKSPRYIGDLSARLTRFAKAFAVDIGTVTTADVQRWLDGLKVAPQTAKNFRTVIHTLFEFAEARGYIVKDGNPVQGVETIKAKGGAIEIYTPAEIAALLEAAPADFRPVLALGAFAGLRSAEAERIEWKDINLAANRITVAADKAKTASRRIVPILPNLAAWLRPYAGHSGRVWKGSPDDLRTARAGAVEKAKTAWKDNAARHSFISYRLAEVQDVPKVALEAGNSPGVIFKHYRELVEPEAAKAWFAVAPEAPANVIPMAKGVANA